MCSLYPQNTLPAVPRGAPVASSIALGPPGIHTLSVRGNKVYKILQKGNTNTVQKPIQRLHQRLGQPMSLCNAPLFGVARKPFSVGQCAIVPNYFKPKRTTVHPSNNIQLMGKEKSFPMFSPSIPRQKRHPSPSWQRQWRLACDLAPYKELASETILKPLKNSNEPRMAETGPLQLTQW